MEKQRQLLKWENMDHSSSKRKQVQHIQDTKRKLETNKNVQLEQQLAQVIILSLSLYLHIFLLLDMLSLLWRGSYS